MLPGLVELRPRRLAKRHRNGTPFLFNLRSTMHLEAIRQAVPNGRIRCAAASRRAKLLRSRPAISQASPFLLTMSVLFPNFRGKGAVAKLAKAADCKSAIAGSNPAGASHTGHAMRGSVAEAQVLK